MPTTPPPPSVLDYLNFSQLAYDITQGNAQSVAIPQGFQQLSVKSNPTGLNAVAFINTTTKQIVVAFRGSVGSPLSYDWAVADKDIATGVRPDVFNQAEDYISSLFAQFPESSGYSYSVTGHSLGGAEAEDVAAAFQIPGVTFAAPGVSNLLTSAASPTYAGVTNYVVSTDVVGNETASSGAHIGKVITLSSVPYLSTLLASGVLGELISPTLSFTAITTGVSHIIYTYGQALFNAGIIPSNPIPQSPLVAVDLAQLSNTIETTFGNLSSQLAYNLMVVANDLSSVLTNVENSIVKGTTSLISQFDQTIVNIEGDTQLLYQDALALIPSSTNVFDSLV